MLKKVGLKGQDTAELFFEDMRLPKSALLGGEEGLNQGFPYLMQELARFVYHNPNLTPFTCLLQGVHGPLNPQGYTKT